MSDARIVKIQVENFRNLSNAVFEFGENINCIFGPNGNGKTNLLELINYIFLRKSFRKNTSFSQFLNIESVNQEITVNSVVKIKSEKNSVTAKINNETQQWFFNNQSFKRKKFGTIVFVNPFDSYSFHTQAAERRSWLDHYLSLYSENYKKNLAKYNKSLRFRNSLLSYGVSEAAKDQLASIDEQIAEYCHVLMHERANFIEGINQYLNSTFRAIFSEAHELKLVYQSKFPTFDKEKIYQILRESEDFDFQTKRTRYGVHRDDFIFEFDGLNSYEFCSLGQQKMSFLSLLFAYIELFRYKFKTYPIVLIDDVSGELDKTRWKNLIEYLSGKHYQVLITTANEEFRAELEKVDDSKRIYIENGHPHY